MNLNVKTVDSMQFFFDRVKEDPYFRYSDDPSVIAQYMVDRSPKLHELATILSSAEFVTNQKILLLTEFPLIAYLVTLFLSLLGVKTEWIRSVHSDEQRAEITADFCDPNSTTAALIGTYKLLGFGYNLQGSEARFIIIDVAILKTMGFLKKYIIMIFHWASCC